MNAQHYGRYSWQALPGAQTVTRTDIDGVLVQVELVLGPEAANMLRAYLAMLEGQLRVHELGSDEE